MPVELTQPRVVEDDMAHWQADQLSLVKQPLGVACPTDRIDQGKAGPESIEQGLILGDNDIGGAVPGAHRGNEGTTIPRWRLGAGGAHYRGAVEAHVEFNTKAEV